MNYKNLKSIYYQDYSSYEEEYFKRLNSIGTIKTSMFPYLMKKESFASSQYPLFVMPLLDILMMMQNIILNSTKISDLATKLPEVAHKQFYQEHLYTAIISTNQIEGIHTTRKDIALAIEALHKKKNAKYVSTVRMYLDILNGDFLHIASIEEIREIYDKLTHGEIDREDEIDGKLFRKDTVSIVNNQSGKIEHIPPGKEDKIIEMLQSWIDFINDENVPFLIKATLGHYFFENIHPFYDGNGRVGRYILANYLSRKLDPFSGLIISKKINESKSSYYKAFSDTGNILNRADGTSFVYTLLKYITKGQHEIIATLTQKIELLEYYHDKLSNLSLTEVQKHIIYLLLQSQLFMPDTENNLTDNDILDLLKHSEFSQRSIKRGIEELEHVGYLSKIVKRPSKHIIVDEFFDF